MVNKRNDRPKPPFVFQLPDPEISEILADFEFAAAIFWTASVVSVSSLSEQKKEVTKT